MQLGVKPVQVVRQVRDLLQPVKLNLQQKLMIYWFGDVIIHPLCQVHIHIAFQRVGSHSYDWNIYSNLPNLHCGADSI